MAGIPPKAPSREQLEKWTTSQMELINDCKGRKEFRAFLEKRCMENYIDFYEECEMLKTEFIKKANEIVTTYLEVGAVNHVSVGKKAVEKIVNMLENKDDKPEEKEELKDEEDKRNDKEDKPKGNKEGKLENSLLEAVNLFKDVQQEALRKLEKDQLYSQFCSSLKKTYNF